MKKIWAYILPTALCFVLGGLAGWLQQDAIEEWYPLLDKPTLTPPNAVFPIAWSIIYLCMGISGGLVLTSEAPARKSAVRLWFLQLGCNFLWSILFFVCQHSWVRTNVVCTLTNHFRPFQHFSKHWITCHSSKIIHVL